MEPRKDTRRGRARLEAGALAALLWMLGAGLALPVLAQEAAGTAATAAPAYSAAELDDLVGRIALYPDDLIAIILPASTYPLEVVEAARFEEKRAQDPSLGPNEDWEDSIVALLNYPEVLKLMNDDLDWTAKLGEAVAAQQAEVFDAIQRFRDRALAAGNLTSDAHQVVSKDDGDVEIKPADPEVVYVPYYAPERVVLRGYGPLYYYPYAYPLYYYPYPAGYSFGTGVFFGVTTAFVIGWHAHYLHVDPCTYIGHPYYGRHYYAPFYVRRSITVNVNLIDRGHGGYAWRSSPHRPRYAHSTRSAHSERAQHTNRSTEHGPDHSFDHGRASGGPGHDDAGRYRGQYTHRNGNGLLYDARRYSGGHGAPGEHATGSASSLAGKHPSGRSGDSTQTDRSGNSTAGGSTTRPGLRFHMPGRSAPSTHAGMAPRTTQRNRNARPGSQTTAPHVTAPHVAAPPPGRTIGGIASRTLRPPSASHSRGSSSGRVQNHGPRASRGHDNGHRSTGNAIRGGRTAER